MATPITALSLTALQPSMASLLDDPVRIDQTLLAKSELVSADVQYAIESDVVAPSTTDLAVANTLSPDESFAVANDVPLATLDDAILA